MEVLTYNCKMFFQERLGLGDNFCDGSGTWLGDGYGFGFSDGSSDGSGEGSGRGYASGDGSGYGYGYGSINESGYNHDSSDGNGYGFGRGSGEGYGYNSGAGWSYSKESNWFSDGSGYGYNGYGCGIKSFCGEAVYMIDDIQTIIHAVHGNVARGAILRDDLTTTPCYIVKQDGRFAHGETLRAAMAALRDKLFANMSEDERIEAFLAEHRPGVEYPVSDLYEWHHRLTGSCEMGRKQFAHDRGIDIDKDSMTIERFCELTRDAYGGKIIKALEVRIKS